MVGYQTIVWAGAETDGDIGAYVKVGARDRLPMLQEPGLAVYSEMEIGVMALGVNGERVGRDRADRAHIEVMPNSLSLMRRSCYSEKHQQ